ncbi:hypothetical protein [uncultured Desulfobacter sp.]|uniref:hypothetical protein n=1 Tax=uncultured Desulfobacter sp. TaxID=240139 RepID=UPI002AABED92|nr:hypothetical protein [uncultured Desulfobacter sp.]
MALCKNQIKFIRDNKKAIKLFVETGFLRGDGVKIALDLDFERIISIEINKDYINKSKSMFTKEITEGKVTIVHGNSAEKLREVLETIDEAAVFYLDAHAHGHGCPLIDELNAIKNHYIKGHVIVVDDVWFIENSVNNSDRAPWANNLTFDRFMGIVQNIFDDTKVEKIEYGQSAYSDGGNNYALAVLNNNKS